MCPFYIIILRIYIHQFYNHFNVKYIESLSIQNYIFLKNLPNIEWQYLMIIRKAVSLRALGLAKSHAYVWDMELRIEPEGR
jgi:hypothetical protein